MPYDADPEQVRAGLPPVTGTPEGGQAPPSEPQAGPDHAADEDALAGAAAELDRVESALARLEDGSFDRCEVCGAPIGRDRLLRDPLLTRCPDHAGPGTAPAPTAEAG